MAQVIVMDIRPRLAMKLHSLPLFRNTRFIKPGRLLTFAEAEARRRCRETFLANEQSNEIAEFYQSELRNMSHIAHSVTQMNISRSRRLRKIRNHSGGMSRRSREQ